MIAYKLLNRDLTTYNQTQWVVGETKRTDGHGGLCGPGWLHAYTHPELAYFLNPIHAAFRDPILYEVEAGGHRLDDGQFKSGWTEMTLIRPSSCPAPTLTQRIRFAIRCSLAVYHEPSYRTWAMNWITSQNRSHEAANTVANATHAAYAEAYAARNAAASAAACAAGHAAEAAYTAAYTATYTAPYTTTAAAVYVAYTATNPAVYAAEAADKAVYAATYPTGGRGTLDLHACAVWAYSDSLDLDEVL